MYDSKLNNALVFAHYSDKCATELFPHVEIFTTLSMSHISHLPLPLLCSN